MQLSARSGHEPPIRFPSPNYTNQSLGLKTPFVYRIRRRAEWQVSSEDAIDRHSPARDRRLGLGFLARPEDFGQPRILILIGADHAVPGVNVPDHKRPRLEIVGAFRSESILGRVAVVVLAPNFDRESGRALDEPSISSAFPSTR